MTAHTTRASAHPFRSADFSTVARTGSAASTLSIPRLARLDPRWLRIADQDRSLADPGRRVYRPRATPGTSITTNACCCRNRANDVESYVNLDAWKSRLACET